MLLGAAGGLLAPPALSSGGGGALLNPLELLTLVGHIWLLLLLSLVLEGALRRSWRWGPEPDLAQARRVAAWHQTLADGLLGLAVGLVAAGVLERQLVSRAVTELTASLPVW
jgi:hypothetical protein